MPKPELIGTRDTVLPADILLEKSEELFESIMAKLKKSKEFGEALLAKYLSVPNPREHKNKVVFENNHQRYELFLFRQEEFDILEMIKVLPEYRERIKITRDKETERADFITYEKTGPDDFYCIFRDSVGAVARTREFIRYFIA